MSENSVVCPACLATIPIKGEHYSMQIAKKEALMEHLSEHADKK